MGAIAVRAAEAVRYANAGTVEFLLDRDQSFYFLEMNTRLQVEHPITEAVTAVDIVKEQLRLAAGEPLRYRQEDIRPVGHAIECRITAEDPFSSFLPMGGRVIRLSQPGGPGVRVDSGIEEGLEVSTFYDSLLAKLVVWGENREEAIRRMSRALREYRVVGLPTSIPFHLWLMDQEAFLNGAYETTFLADTFSLAEPDREMKRPAAALVAALLHHQQRQRAHLTASPCDGENGRTGWGSDRAWKMVGRREAMGS
jgi:acetyl/propionyl-CoA carboxylase alpha subunit